MLSNSESAPDFGVTFCIPNWNHKNYLPRCIRSALSTARVLLRLGIRSQILVVDDCSRDGSQRMLMAIAMAEPLPIIDVIMLPENRGLAAARNIGLMNAGFRYVCFLDADNELYAENFPLFVRSIAATNAAVVYGNLIRHDGQRSVGLLSNDYVHDGLYDDNYIDAFALCDRDKFLHYGGYEEHLRSHEDWEIYLHLLSEGEDVVFVPSCMGYYYVNPNSMVQTEKTFDRSRFHRIFSQRGRRMSPLDKKPRMYHPDLGWLR